MRHTFKLMPLFLLFVVPVSFAQDITARFYPEKQEYVVGEPIVIVLEVTNGSSQTINVDESNCGWMNPQQFRVSNAPLQNPVGLDGCFPWGFAGDCLGNIVPIASGEKVEQKLLLDGPGNSRFDLSSPGTYHVIASRQVRIYGDHFGEVIERIDAKNDFEIGLRDPYEGELEAIYARFERQLDSTSVEGKTLAAQALTEDPPDFLQPVILSLADSRDVFLRYQSVIGLKHLATAAARTKLVEMASESGRSKGLAEQAISALGEIGNPEDCAAILKIASQQEQSRQATDAFAEAQAYKAAGGICRKKAIPTLIGRLTSAQGQVAAGITAALGNTGSREAVAPLIALLGSPDRWVRMEAEGALFTLTHRERQDVSTPQAAIQLQADWRSWWFMNSESATIYGPDQCPATQQR